MNNLITSAIFSFFILNFILLSSLQAQTVQVSSFSLAPLPAKDCNNTMATVNMQIGCANAVHFGNTFTVSGSTITINVDYNLGIICLPAIIYPVQTVNLGMLAAGTYNVVVNGLQNSAVVSTQTTSLVVTSCCPITVDFAVSPDTICPGDSVNFSNLSTMANSYMWYENDSLEATTQDFGKRYNQSGNYKIKLVASDGSCADSITKTIVVRDEPVVDLGPDTTICLGDTLILDATNFNASYIWQDNATTAMYEVTSAGVYSVRVQTPFGCQVSDSIEVFIDPCGVGVSDVKNEVLVNLYPNPGNGILNIRIDGISASDINFRLFDLAGRSQEIKSRRTIGTDLIEMDVTNLPAGIYVIHWQSADQSGQFKYVIQ